MRPTPDQFTALPMYHWDARPETLSLTRDECETALFLANGDVKAAAARLKVPVKTLNKEVRRMPHLRRLIERMTAPTER